MRDRLRPRRRCDSAALCRRARAQRGCRKRQRRPARAAPTSALRLGGRPVAQVTLQRLAIAGIVLQRGFEPRDMALDQRQPFARDEIAPLRHHPLRRRRSLSSLFDEGAGHFCDLPAKYSSRSSGGTCSKQYFLIYSDIRLLELRMPSYTNVTDQTALARHGDPTALYLRSFEVQNYRCFRSRQTLDFVGTNDLPARWTIILGENGSGKSTILECIAASFPVTTGFIEDNRSDAEQLELPSDSKFSDLRLQTDYAGNRNYWRNLISGDFHTSSEFHVGDLKEALAAEYEAQS